MPKRIGYLYEKVIDPDSCAQAVIEMTRGKHKNRRAMIMRENAAIYGKNLANDLASGRWVPAPYKEHTVQDGTHKKERRIKVPCLRDQAVHHAIMRITTPYIERRNYFYNCGSLPGAGQIRATRAMRRWMSGHKVMKYCVQLDIRHFYENCPHWAVMQALGRIFKDKRFLDLHRRILASMGDGLAIGFYPSQWYANLVLMWVDFRIKQKIIPECRYVRYMDDMCILGNNKRKLHRARDAIALELAALGMTLKRNHRLFKIGSGGVQFLSYRFFKGYTLLKKELMYRISRGIRRALVTKTLHRALSAISYVGLLKHCDSYNFRLARVYPLIKINRLRRFISHENRAGRIAGSLQSRCDRQPRADHLL